MVADSGADIGGEMMESVIVNGKYRVKVFKELPKHWDKHMIPFMGKEVKLCSARLADQFKFEKKGVIFIKFWEDVLESEFQSTDIEEIDKPLDGQVSFSGLEGVR